jgi:S1/P1 nuclease
VRTLTILILVGICAASPAEAWHDTGHRAIASIAFDALKPDQQLAIVSVLRTHPRFADDFAAHMPDPVAAGSILDQGRWLLQQASIWPDLIQELEDDSRREYDHKSWHYINIPVYLTDEDEAALAGQLKHNVETRFTLPLRQELNIIQALRGNLTVWRDKSASDVDKAIALCWILHLTGDLHQPLHNVALFSQLYFKTGDRGGNDIEVSWGTGTRNLHAVWDGLPTDMDDLKPSARTLLTIKSETIDDASIDEWLGHHAGLARLFVYPADVKNQLIMRLANHESPRIEVSHDYLVQARSIARRQVNLAGHRIAVLLN